MLEKTPLMLETPSKGRRAWLAGMLLHSQTDQ